MHIDFGDRELNDIHVIHTRTLSIKICKRAVKG